MHLNNIERIHFIKMKHNPQLKSSYGAVQVNCIIMSFIYISADRSKQDNFYNGNNKNSSLLDDSFIYK